MTIVLLIHYRDTDWIWQELLLGISDIPLSEGDENGNMRLFEVNCNSHFTGGIDL